MIIIENEIKRLDDAKAQLNLIKECLWLIWFIKTNTRVKGNTITRKFLFWY